ncbi:MAG: DUF3048 domain-containing protein [Saccharofermentans sp.]|nr:DUF3048 domain-containing protein [Saccharofermentans sp.]
MNFKKVIASIMTFTLILPMAACKKTDESESQVTEASVIMSSESETTTTETTTEATTTTTTGLYDPNNSLAINPITGLQDMDPSNVGLKGVSVVVNNVSVSLPQKGVSEADCIYEYETEGGVTRLLCVYADVNTVPEIGSLRSARLVSADLAAGMDTIFIHFGREPRAVNHFSDCHIKHVDGNYLCAGKYDSSDYENGYVELPSGCFFWRDKKWTKKRAIEHTAVSSGAHIAEAIAYKDISLETGLEETPMILNFVPDNSVDIANATETCTAINVYFSASNDDALFEYNATDGMYYKSEYGNPQMDMNNDQQVCVKNVFVLYGRVQAADDGYRTDYFLNEGGEGYYICDGKLVHINWIKNDIHEPIVITNDAGEVIEVNRGTSYFCMVRQSQKDKTTITP